MKKGYFVGIDISKDKIDICFLSDNSNLKPKFETIPNKSEVIKAYFKSFVKDNLTVVFEYTNNYHVSLQQVLSELKFKYSVIDPYKVSHFLKFLSFDKSDLKDSFGLATYAKTFCRELNPATYNKEYNLVKSYNAATLLLSKIQTQIKNFKKSQELVSDLNLDDALKTLLAEVQKLQAKIKLLAYELLKSFIPNADEIIKNNKGFGVDLALNLFPILHFNRDKSAKEFISFLGLSPRIYESGSSVKKRGCINKKGSSALRRSLFLTALSSVRFNEVFKQRYERLINQGKKAKVALVAVMCAIVRYLKTKFAFDDGYINGNLHIVKSS